MAKKRKYHRKPVGTALVRAEQKPPAKVPAKQLTEQTMAALVLKGDLSGLSPVQKMEYYHRLCEHLRLDPVTRPFDIINIRGREVMYAHKGCTDQLRKMNGVSVTDIKGEQVADVYRVTAIGHDKTGRTDAATGVVSIGRLGGDELANALMKAETKAKRRLTLSLCGLGMLDETEIETIPGAINVDFSELNGKPVERMPDGTPTITGKPAGSLGNRLTTLIASPHLMEDERAKIREEYRALCKTPAQRDAYLVSWEDVVIFRGTKETSDEALLAAQNKPVFEVGSK